MSDTIGKIADVLREHKNSNVKEIIESIPGGRLMTAILLEPHISGGESFGIRYIAPGKSGAKVLLVMIDGKKPRVIKFGEKSVIEKEKNNYEDKVKESMPSGIMPFLSGSTGRCDGYTSISYH